MSASIRVDSGISAGASYWIERPVLRIGSDPQCDICLPSADLAPHTLTLEFRDGSYRAYNRGTSHVTVGKSLLNPGGNAVWNPGDTIQLPGDTRLTLTDDGDPRPMPRPDSRPDDGFNDDRSLLSNTVPDATTPDPAIKKSSSSLIQLGIIAVCILAIVGLLMLKNLGSSTATAAPNRLSFEEIVNASLSREEPYRALVRRLQYAEAAHVRGNSRLARERFLKLRDEIVYHNQSLSPEDRADTDQVLAYVEFRLGQM